MIAPDAIRQIKAAAPLLEDVKLYVQLKPSGRTSYLGLCPFHKEDTPSFTVHSRQASKYADSFKCFGCGASGDVITFTALIESVSKGRAIRLLADRHGIDLTGKRQTRRQVHHINDLAAQAEFWWRRRLRAIEEHFAKALDDLWIGEELEVSDAAIERLERSAEASGAILQVARHLNPELRGRLFLRERTPADLRDYRDLKESEKRLLEAIRAPQ